MENTRTDNERFDAVMREAIAGIGTSYGFTRRLMARLEQEKEMARVRRQRRIGAIVAVVATVWILALSAGVLFYFRDEQVLPLHVLGQWKDRLLLPLSESFATSPVSLLVNIVVAGLSVFAVMSWDAVLGLFFTKRK